MFKYIASLTILLGLASGILLSIYSEAPERDELERLASPRTIAGIPGSGWRVVFFGFTRCPDVCPTNLAELAELNSSLPDLNVVFVSLDPQDSAEAVSRYAHAFHPGIRGFKRDREDMQTALDGLGIRYAINASGAIAHSATYSVISPADELVARFRPGFAVQSMAAALQALYR